MIEPGMYIRGDGSVFGTFKYVTDYTGFSGDASLQKGYYFPFSLGVTGTKVTTKKNGVVVRDNVAYEKDWVFRVSKNDTFDILVDNKKVATFNFKNSRFGEE